tara:strand:- start:37 stop:519 length:483 start_codon:yes stop_codon:yes gene_type:complete
MNFSNRLMRQPQQTKSMEFIDYVAQQPRIEWEPEKLTKEQLLNDCIEDNGLYYLIDENHSGLLFLTDEVAQKYNIKCGEGARDDAEPIDWDIWCEPDELAEYRDKGYKWSFDIMQCAGVYDKDGNQVKEAWNDEDVYIMNGIVEEMLDEEGCEVMGWCDG